MRLIVELTTVSFVLNNIGRIQFYTTFVQNNLLYNVRKILLKAEQYKKKVRIKINKKIIKLGQIF